MTIQNYTNSRKKSTSYVIQEGIILVDNRKVVYSVSAMTNEDNYMKYCATIKGVMLGQATVVVNKEGNSRIENITMNKYRDNGNVFGDDGDSEENCRGRDKDDEQGGENGGGNYDGDEGDSSDGDGGYDINESKREGKSYSESNSFSNECKNEIRSGVRDLCRGLYIKPIINKRFRNRVRGQIRKNFILESVEFLNG